MDYLTWSYSGIDLAIDGTGGEACVNYLPMWQRVIESLSFVLISMGLISWSWSKLTVPLPLPQRQVSPSPSKNGEVDHCGSGYDKETSECRVSCQVHHDWPGRRIVLLIHSLTFGVEIGYKLSSRSVLWLLNPCHMVTAVQLFILSAPPSPLLTSIFRLHMHMLNGPIVAIVFPVLNTRSLPLEKVIYYVQHALIVLIPFFLLRQGRLFTAERIGDFSWIALSIAIQSMYHFVLLQVIGLWTWVNLDNMLCPAISDPFRGRCYRIWAMTHQSALVLIFGKSLTKLYGAVSNAVGKPSASDVCGPVRFAELRVAANLPRMLEAIPEPFGEIGCDKVAPSSSNGRLKTH